jgi:predicted ribosomally synthesized peptide with nif11-like leader
MSIENAKAFYQRVMSDEDFRIQLQGYSVEKRTELIQALGFNFTQKEWNLVSDEALEHILVTEELSETELQAIAGGRLAAVYVDPV